MVAAPGIWWRRRFYGSLASSPAGAATGGNIGVASGFAAGATNTPAELSLAAVSVDVAQPLAIPVSLATNGAPVTAAAFTLNFDVACFTFDPVDSEPDGILDNVSLLASSTNFQLGADTAAQGPGQVRVVVSPKDSTRYRCRS